MKEYPYYIAGEFKKSNNVIAIENPVTAEPIAQIYETTSEDLKSAVDAAREASLLWREISKLDRANTLREIQRAILEHLSILAELETREIGKPHKESLFVDIPLAADCFGYYASFLETFTEELHHTSDGTDYIDYVPFGTCGVYLPYNVPLMIFGFSCAAALAGGNSLIVKPSEYGSLSLLELAKVIDRLDIPKGLINIVSGPGVTVGAHLARSPVDLISFTGSRGTLKKIVSESSVYPKKILCELGGANCTVIYNDADCEEAVQNVLGSAFMKQGQICIGTSIVLIEEKVYDRCVARLLEGVKTITLGDPFSATCTMGALPTKGHRDEVHARVQELVNKGNRLLTGGEIPSLKGYFYPPTIIEIDEILYEEFFAPVLLVKKVKNNEEIKKILRNNPTGLVAQLWSKDIVNLEKIAKTVSCGTIWLNTFARMNSATPFGGTKQSGWGRNLGKSGFFEYVQCRHLGIGFDKSPVSGWFGIP
ncbi:MAG: aldehyde dehydrogenase [Candidatus Omnitrophica bacterium]|nr:aldehyde dehydrogenase [Candidatus Omnitrophota bacterium]